MVSLKSKIIFNVIFFAFGLIFVPSIFADKTENIRAMEAYLKLENLSLRHKKFEGFCAEADYVNGKHPNISCNFERISESGKHFLDPIYELNGMASDKETSEFIKFSADIAKAPDCPVGGMEDDNLTFPGTRTIKFYSSTNDKSVNCQRWLDKDSGFEMGMEVFDSELKPKIARFVLSRKFSYSEISMLLNSPVHRFDYSNLIHKLDNFYRSDDKNGFDKFDNLYRLADDILGETFFELERGKSGDKDEKSDKR